MIQPHVNCVNRKRNETFRMKIVDVPPIVEVSVADEKNVLATFAKRTLAFGESLKANKSDVLRRSGKPKFNMYQSARAAADMVPSTTKRFDRSAGSTDRLFCYVLGGLPVGVIMCEGDNRGYEHVAAVACNHRIERVRGCASGACRSPCPWPMAAKDG